MNTIVLLLVLVGQFRAEQQPSLVGTSAHVGATTTVRVANTTPISIRYNQLDESGRTFTAVWHPDWPRYEEPPVGATCQMEFGGIVRVVEETARGVIVSYASPRRPPFGCCPTGVIAYLNRDSYIGLEARYRQELAHDASIANGRNGSKNVLHGRIHP